MHVLVPCLLKQYKGYYGSTCLQMWLTVYSDNIKIGPFPALFELQLKWFFKTIALTIQLDKNFEVHNQISWFIRISANVSVKMNAPFSLQFLAVAKGNVLCQIIFISHKNINYT